MPIISVEIMKTIDEREIQKTTKEKQTKAEGARGTEAIVKEWWKRNAENNKEKQTKAEEARGTEAIVKEWELNDFVVHLS